MPPSNRTLIGLGILSAAMGGIPILTGLGVLTPEVGGSDPAPSWVALLAGLMFVLAGMAVILKGATGAGECAGGLPRGVPRLLRFAYELIVLAIAGSLAMIASWVAFGPGERHFSTFTNFGGFAVGAEFGRAFFGFGATLAWFIAAALLLHSARQWFSRL